MRKLFVFGLFLFLFLLPGDTFSQNQLEECSVGVASGSATVGGRPLLWKNRDTDALHNEVNYFTDGRFKYLALVSAGHSNDAWAGVNEMGFCIINSASNDLKEEVPEDGLENGTMMKLALQNCVNIDDFEKILTESNAQGRNTSANFGVIDAFGGAAFFETGFFSYTKFDANDPKIAPQGYIVRANFAKTGGGSGGKIRYDRAERLWQQAVSHHQLNYRLILRNFSRDLADDQGKPYNIPFNGKTENYPRGAIDTHDTINRYATASVALFYGVKPDENPSLTTFWTILGEPVFSVAVPGWVICETVAPELDGELRSPLCERVLELKNANYFNFGKKLAYLRTKNLKDIWKITFAAEDQIFAAIEQKLAAWRQNYPRSATVAEFHNSQSAKALAAVDHVIKKLNIDTRKIQVGVFADYGASDVCVKETAAALKIDPQIEVTILDAADVSRGALANLDVIVVPGGSGSREAVSLGDDGREKMNWFIDNGGGYVGICAGAYLGSDHSSYQWRLGLADALVIDREHYDRGAGLVKAKLTKHAKELLPEFANQSEMFCYYHGGPLLAAGENPNLDDYEELAVFESDVHTTPGSPEGKMPGTTFLLSGKKGKGRVILCSGHPESTTGLRWLTPRMARWTAQVELVPYGPQFVKIDKLNTEMMIDSEFTRQEKKLLNTFKTSDKTAAKSAMKQLLEMKSREFQRWIPDLLRDSDPVIRNLAAEMILDLDIVAARDDLEAALLNETDEGVKSVMADALGKLKVE